MKNNLLILLALLALAACQTKSPLQNSKTIVCGKITDFEKIKLHNTIELKQWDILKGDFNHTASINSNGEFRFELDLEYPTELLLLYTAGIPCYIYPGDSLFIAIDGNCKLVQTKSYNEELKFYELKSTSQEMLDDVIKYRHFYGDSLFKYKQMDSALRASTPMEYFDFIQSDLKRMEEGRERFVKLNKPCLDFQNWVVKEQKFDAWNQLMRYWWLHAYKNGKDLKRFQSDMPDEYYSFLSEWNIEDQTNLNSNSYIDFVQEYFGYEYQKVVLGLDTVGTNLFENDFPQFMDTVIHQISKPEGQLKSDLLIAKIYSTYLVGKEYTKLKNVFEPALIKNDWLRSLIVRHFDEEKMLHENPNYAQGSYLNEIAEENDFLQALMAKYPNKVLYLDFWAPWCSPCMDEMSYAKAIKKQMEGKDVVFVYLGNRCDEAAWKATIAEKQIEGEHYLLNETQFAQLSEIFEVQGIPHFAIIDKEGNIAEQKTLRPSSGDRLIKLLEELL